MPYKRPLYDGLDDEQEQQQVQVQQVEHATSVKVTWIAAHLYQSWSNIMPLVYLAIYPADLHIGLNEKRESERDRLNRRLANADLLPRPSRTIQRPRGEAGRTGTTSSGQRRSGFVLKEFLRRESNLNDIHYTMIQVSIPLSSLLQLISRIEHRPPSGCKAPRYPAHVEREPRERLSHSLP
jgi:hypothetical protein